MRTSLFVVLAAALASVSAQNYLNPRRLIKTSETEEKWMGEKEIFELIATGKNFMDITDHQKVSSAPKSDLVIPSGPENQDLVFSFIEKIDQNIQERNLDFYSDFYTRYYTSETGIAAADWLYELISSYALNRTDITVTQFSHSGYGQKSVIARIQGTSGIEDLVILGAHLDSINVRNPSGGRSPGADDDGSGCMTIGEVFRILASEDFKPYYNLEFQFYAAEEVGLLGSQDIADYYAANGVPVYGMFQVDMTGYTPSPESPVKVIHDYVDAELTAYTITLLEEYTDFSWRAHNCGYGCSDHASYYRSGYRSSSTFEAQTNPRIHTEEDDMDLIDWDHVYGFTRYSMGYAVEMSLQ